MTTHIRSNFRRLALASAAAILCSSLFAKTWRNTDGSRTFEGDFISHNGSDVTIRNTEGEDLTFPITRLHPDDQQWVRKKPGDPDAALEPDNNAAFETLHFGDDRKTVIAKLKHSQIVTSGVVEELSGRTGLNGMFHTKEKIGGFTYSLFFGWNSQDKLNEVVLRSEPANESAYLNDFRATWREIVSLMSMLHGNPIVDTEYPERDVLQEGMAMNSHLWRLESGGSALVGIGMEHGKFILTATITQKHIKPTAE